MVPDFFRHFIAGRELKSSGNINQDIDLAKIIDSCLYQLPGRFKICHITEKRHGFPAQSFDLFGNRLSIAAELSYLLLQILFLSFSIIRDI